MTQTIEKKLPFNKVLSAASYSTIEKLRNFDLFICNESNSQLMKRLDAEEAADILDLLKKGNQVNLS